MFYDPQLVRLLTPQGDPAPEALYREEYLKKPARKAQAVEPTDPELIQTSRSIRAQVLARASAFFA